jgi:hypothetical protein
MRLRTKAILILVLASLLLCVNIAPMVQAWSNYPSSEDDLKITATLQEGQPLKPDDKLELQLNRSLNKAENRLAILLGQTDITGLFIIKGKSLTYNRNAFPLAVGENTLVVYLVSGSEEWKEIARFTFKVTDPKAVDSTPPAKTEITAPEKPDATAKENVEAEKNPTKPEGKPEEKNSEKTEVKAGEKSNEKAATDAVEKNGEKVAKEGAEKSEEKTTQDAPPAESEKPAQEGQAEAAGSEQAQTETPKRIGGFEKLEFTPSFTIGFESQAAESHFPEENRPARPTFADFNLQGSFKNEMQRGLFNSQTQFDIAGTSFREKALNFAKLGEAAPLVDLASYLMQFQIGKAKIVTGHTSYGTNRHLVNSFSSRGITLVLPLNNQVDFSMAALNGSTVVGTGNFFGLNNRKHQMLGSTLGFELLPQRPGGVRAEVSYLNGYVLPVSSFTEGSVNDAERSRGMGVRFIASDTKQRFRFEGGFARSQFFNPDDALLSQGNNLVAIPTVTRNARYIETGFDILKELAITESRKMNLTFNYRHERVDPLYRSLAASTAADKIQNQFEWLWSLGDITAQFSHVRFNDNLANIPSILKALNRAQRFSFSAPLLSIFGDPNKPNPFLPRVAYTFDRGYQFSEAIPINGGFEFAPEAIPNQLATVQSLSFEWQFQKLRLGYRTNHSFQNNRQIGLELADLINLANGISVGLPVSPTFDLNVEFSFDSASSKETGRIDRTYRLAPSITWRMNQRATLTTSLSTTFAGDVTKLNQNRNVEFDLQWAYQFSAGKDRFKKVQSQAFIRYANRYASSRDNVFNLNNLTKAQTLNVGLSFTFF